MKARFLIILSVVSVLQIEARKSPTVVDSFSVNPVFAPNIRFNGQWVGTLTPKDSTDWYYTPSIRREVKPFGYKLHKTSTTEDDLFSDCVFFCPPLNTSTKKAGQLFFGANFFMNPIKENVETSSGGMVPASIRFFLDSSHICTAVDNVLNSDTFPIGLVDDYLRPFYFRKYEVTNKEYREFYNWVVDSITRVRLNYLLPNGMLDRTKKVDPYNLPDSIAQLKLKPNQRFYTRDQLDVRQIVYRFQNKPEGYSPSSIVVYPDSTRWLLDFTFSYNEPMQNMYHWHPAYDDYPVTGVSYWQCLAYLEWKTMQLTNQLKGKYNVLCALPSEIEWDYVSTAESADQSIELMARNYTGTCDDSWLTDLMLTRDSTITHSIYDSTAFRKIAANGYDQIYVAPSQNDRNSKAPLRTYSDHISYPLRTFNLHAEKTWGDFIYDGYFHTGPVNITKNGFPEKNPDFKGREVNERTRAHYDNTTSICWLDGNVSEWMREDLDENWRGIFSKHLVVVDGPYRAEEQLVRNYEKYYYDQLPEHGKLVRGCNWYDERFAMKYGKNVAGTQAKTFCDPNKSHCTLGFRYVIYLSEK